MITIAINKTTVQVTLSNGDNFILEESPSGNVLSIRAGDKRILQFGTMENAVLLKLEDKEERVM